MVDHLTTEIREETEPNDEINVDFFRRFISFWRIMYYSARLGARSSRKPTVEEDIRYSLQSMYHDTEKYKNDPRIEAGRYVIRRYLGGEQTFSPHEQEFIDFINHRLRSDSPPMPLIENIVSYFRGLFQEKRKR